MGVPLTYNLRSLVQRKGTTIMTAIGIALTVAVLVISMSLVRGLRETFAGSGHPLQGIILRDGTDAELNSDLSPSSLQEFRSMRQVARDDDGNALVSPEVVTVINLPSVDSPTGMNVTLRGLLPIGTEMRDIRIVQGTMFRAGQREVIVGAGVARRYPTARLGATLKFGRGEWTVVGIFSPKEEMAAVASEMWADLNQVRSDLDRQGSMSSALIRAQSPADLDEIAQLIDDNRRVGARVIKEREYYASMTSSGAPLQALGIAIATIMAIGSGFGAMNTMYAAVARRGREIGTLRSLGFSRFSILRSFMFEAMMLALLGGLIGCLLALPVNNLTTGVGNFATFSEVAFRFKVTWDVMARGVLFAVIIGAVGGFLPALAASRRDLITTLREG